MKVKVMSLNEDIKEMVQSQGLIFYDAELVNEDGVNIFRVLIMKEKGSINLKDCTKISNLISPLLDVKEPTSSEYNLEVSSVGLERSLKKVEHFKLSIGSLVKVKIEDEKIKGTLTYANDECIKVNEKQINLNDIKKARTYINW